MKVTIDDLLSEHEMCEKLNMRLDNLKRMRQSDEYRYNLLVRGAFVENFSFEILAKSIDVVDRLDRGVAIDKLIRANNEK